MTDHLALGQSLLVPALRPVGSMAMANFLSPSARACSGYS